MTRLEKKHPLAVRWFHWLNFPVLATMIWSGLLIYWANDVYRIGPLHLFPDLFYHPGSLGGSPIYSLDHRLAEGMGWHFLFMWLFAVNGIAYVCYTAISGEWRLLVPNRRSFADALQVVLHDLHLRREAPPQQKYNGAQRTAYTSIIVMGAGSLLTGLAIYKPIQLSGLDALFGGYQAARFIHFWLTAGYCLFFVVHVAQVIRAGWNNFRAMVTGYELAPDDEPDREPAAPEAHEAA